MDNSGQPSRSPSPADEQRILSNWQPEPLVPEVDVDENKHLLNPPVITSKAGLADDVRLESSSVDSVRKYGVGSCGPRAFYGTMDVHLRLEEALAKFLRLEEAVLYSYGFSTIASAIPAYAKSTDVIFADEMCNFAIQQGIKASKSRLIKFRHNDMKHLEQLIEELSKEQMKRYGKPIKLRTFLLVEGIYAKTGDLCPLDKLVELKKRHKIRLFIDESRSFGVVGACGRGITEHYNADINDVDLVMVSLEHALCSYGGFCAGSSFVVDHQRLAGAGYCFSASLPPMQCQVALESLQIIEQNPELIKQAQDNFLYAHKVLKNMTGLENISAPESPIKILVIRHKDTSCDVMDPRVPKNNQDTVRSYAKEEKILRDLCIKILSQKRIAICVSSYLVEEEFTKPVASIRLIISGCLSFDDIDQVCLAIDTTFKSTISHVMT